MLHWSYNKCALLELGGNTYKVLPIFLSDTQQKIWNIFNNKYVDKHWTRQKKRHMDIHMKGFCQLSFPRFGTPCSYLLHAVFYKANFTTQKGHKSVQMH